VNLERNGREDEESDGLGLGLTEQRLVSDEAAERWCLPPPSEMRCVRANECIDLDFERGCKASNLSPSDLVVTYVT
jgi:hypothetical protein